jgi:hypothetical protein
VRVFEAGAALAPRGAGGEGCVGVVGEHFDGELKIPFGDEAVECCRVIPPCRVVVASVRDGICGGKGQAEGGGDGQGFAEFGAVVAGFQIDEELA